MLRQDVENIYTLNKSRTQSTRFLESTELDEDTRAVLKQWWVLRSSFLLPKQTLTARFLQQFTEIWSGDEMLVQRTTDWRQQTSVQTSFPLSIVCFEPDKLLGQNHLGWKSYKPLQTLFFFSMHLKVVSEKKMIFMLFINVPCFRYFICFKIKSNVRTKYSAP